MPEDKYAYPTLYDSEMTKLRIRNQKLHRVLLEVMTSMHKGMTQRQVAALKRKITNILVEE